ncbi:MAG: hypothetical protein ACE5LS_03030 [Thermoplasmata archaeon]
MESGYEYRRRAKGTLERFLLVRGRVWKAVVVLREDHALLVDVKEWKPSRQRLRELRRKMAGDRP